MAQYKVLQDIEAEDKLLGPLSLRQFIYAVIVVVLGFVAFKLATVKFFLAIPFGPPIIFFALLAAPFGRDQPSEVWLLAKIRFFVKTRRRIWDQAGIKNLVTITVPKKIEKVYTKGFSNDEVTSRLKALSATMDTRGWAVKNVNTASFQQPVLIGNQSDDDRLVNITSNQGVVEDNVDPESDVLNEATNPVAQQVDQSLSKSTQSHRQQLLEKVHKLAQQQTLGKQPVAQAQVTPPPSVSKDDQVVLNTIKRRNQAADLSTAHMRTIQPAAITQQSVQASVVPVPTTPQTSVTPISDPGILKLVKSNDLNVATIAREANKGKDDSQDEVVISLH